MTVLVVDPFPVFTSTSLWGIDHGQLCRYQEGSSSDLILTLMTTISTMASVDMLMREIITTLSDRSSFLVTKTIQGWMLSTGVQSGETGRGTF